VSKIIKKWTWTIVLLLLFSPFYLLGATLGVFVGTTVRGYHDNLHLIRDIHRDLWRKEKGAQGE